MAVRLALYALLGLLLRTAAFLDRETLFEDDNLLTGVLSEKLEGGEYTGGTGADYYDIVFLLISSLFF